MFCIYFFWSWTCTNVENIQILQPICPPFFLLLANFNTIMKELLSKKASRANSYAVVALAANNPKRYQELVEIIKKNETPYSEKAAWAMTHCFDEKLGFFTDYFADFTQILADSAYSDSVKRNIVRVLQFQEIPEEFQGSIIDSCFHLVTKKDTAVAVKAFALGILENMVKLYPELTNELVACIEDLLPNASSGLKNRGQHILRRLNK